MKFLKYYLLSVVVIVVDQIVKLLVHFNMDLHEEIPILGDFFLLHYTENAGMAFGWELDWAYGKLLLTFFRLLAMVAIGYYVYYLARKRMPKGLIWCVALILGGAIGNVLDSIFYGVYLDNAPVSATSKWFHGKVVDMFYINIWQGTLPDWVPFFGGDYLSLWPIFNIADASIFIGVLIILLFQKKFFAQEQANKEEKIAGAKA